ncbi:MAG: DUF393 domain-containing protein [Bacteroidales bacterium]|nr:DUF393 domain-containing protein [Bacteroidales bacterium]
MRIESPLILFDGFCHLCDRSVSFVIRRDRKRLFRYVALQSEAGELLRDRLPLPPGTDSVVLVEKGVVYTESEAALRIAARLPFPWSLAVIFRMVPRFIRDMFYRWIAVHRYTWFGRRGYCRIPAREERERFLTIEELRDLL